MLSEQKPNLRHRDASELHKFWRLGRRSGRLTGIFVCCCALGFAPNDSGDRGYLKYTAVNALGEIKDFRAFESLLAAVKDGDSYLRQLATRALGEIRDPRAIIPLIALLKDRDPSIRTRAAAGLGTMGDTRAVEPLIALLDDESDDVRCMAAEVLGQLKDRRALKPLIAAANRRDLRGPEFAKFAIGQILWETYDPQGLQPLIDALDETDAVEIANLSFRRFDFPDLAIKVLGKINDPRLVKSLVAALEAPKDYNRLPVHRPEYLVDVLGLIKSPLAVDPLIAALKKGEAVVRTHAADALGEIRDARAIEPLIAALIDQGEGPAAAGPVGEHAAIALNKIEDSRKINLLTAAISAGKGGDQDLTLRARAVYALGNVNDPRARDLAIPLIAVLSDKRLDSWYGRRRASAVWALGEVRDVRAVEPLIAALHHKEYTPLIDQFTHQPKEAPDSLQSRTDAAYALGKIKDPRSVKPLTALLQDKKNNLQLREVAANSLPVEALIAALRDKDADVRGYVATALGRLGDRRAVEPLIVALRDEDEDVRLSAASALGSLGDPRAVEPLIAILRGG